MLNIALAFCTFLMLFVFLLFGVNVGRYYGQWKIAHNPDHKLQVIPIAEGAVFALLGLIMAFTFTGAYDRFEARKMYIIDEAHTIETANLRIGLLAPSVQAAMRKTLHDYVDARILLYGRLSDLGNDYYEYKRTVDLKDQLWNLTIQDVKLTNDQATTQLFVPAINDVFEIASKRLAITKVHPPLVIFGLLIGLAFVCALLTGYNTAKTESEKSIHILSFVIITAFTIYVIIDLELPRMGLVRVSSFDQLLMDARNNLK